jgi:beta-phosphoglucomutase-like phosphatase (HAD superfamily)
MVLAAASRLGVAPGDVAVVGDIGADVGAARAAGARSVLVPTPVTRPEEVDGGAGGAPRTCSPPCGTCSVRRRRPEVVAAGAEAR